jgi:serine/threonine protein kinase
MEQQASQAPLDDGVRVGDYVIQRALGHDGQGHRYLARDHSGLCVLHELFPKQAVRRGDAGIEPVDPGDRSALRWWARSYLDRARQFAEVRHPALATIAASFESGGTAWHASRPSTGTPLSTLIEQGRTFDPPSVQRLLADILDALSAIHAQSLVHRAVDPRQVWLQADGSAMLRGFGSLRGSLRLHLHAVHSVVSPPYAAPEELTPDAPVDGAADVYALAAIAWQLVSGQSPPALAERGGAAALRSRCGDGWPEALIDDIERGLDPDPARRPTAQQWRQNLAPTVTPARRTGTVTPASPQRSNIATLAAASAVLVGLGLGVWWWLRTPAPPVPVMQAAKSPPSVAMPATAVNRPRFMPTSLAAEVGGPALDQAALDRISNETQPDGDEAAVATAPPIAAAAAVASVAPAPTATPSPERQKVTASVDARPTASVQAVAATPVVSATPPPRAPASAVPAPPAGIEVAALQPVTVPSLSPDEAARIEAEERARAKATQLALERSRCDRHVSELFANRDFTYADIAAFDDVVKLGNGRLQTPSMRTDDGRRVSFLIDRNGCIVRVVR